VVYSSEPGVPGAAGPGRAGEKDFKEKLLKTQFFDN
jgi:hypothetical protein